VRGCLFVYTIGALLCWDHQWPQETHHSLVAVIIWSLRNNFSTGVESATSKWGVTSYSYHAQHNHHQTADRYWRINAIDVISYWCSLLWSSIFIVFLWITYSSPCGGVPHLSSPKDINLSSSTYQTKTSNWLLHIFFFVPHPYPCFHWNDDDWH